jgi:hypothetical protein
MSPITLHQRTNGEFQALAGINVEKTFSFSWSVDLNTSSIEASPDWSFRVLPSGAIWNGTGGQEIFSSQFTILESPKTSTTSSTSSATSTATTSNSTTATSEPTTISTPSNDGNGLSSGAKAGVGVGVAVGAVVLVALLMFFWRKVMARRQRTRGIHEAPDGSVYISPDHRKSRQLAQLRQPPMDEDYLSRPTLAKVPSEIDAGADGQRNPLELDGTR